MNVVEIFTAMEHYSEAETTLRTYVNAAPEDLVARRKLRELGAHV